MSTSVVIPDFPFTAHYYAEILEDLTQYMRVNCPELTDEDPTEPHIQLLRAFSLAYHLNSTLLDLVANEMFLPTAKLRTSHVALLALIDVQLAQATPASAMMLSKTSQLFTAPRTVIPATSLFATLETKSAEAVEFETLADVAITLRTDQVGHVFDFRNSAVSWQDDTTAARAASGFSVSWDPAVADAVYIGHPDVMFDQINVTLSSPSSGITGVWEYFDGDLDEGQPTSVVNNGNNLTFVVNAILGNVNRSGTIVRIRSALTGSFQDLVVSWDGTNNNITTSGTTAFLGQTSPSLLDTDYIAGSAWRELANIVDGTAGLTTTGALTYTLPQSVAQEWTETLVGSGSISATGFWIRFRIIAVSAPVAPVFTGIRIDQGGQYLGYQVVQGHSRTDNPLGSSDGTPSQAFTFTQFPVIDDSNISVIVTEATVDQTYNRVDNFLNSLPTDRHYTLAFDDDGAGDIVFGDGVNGKIPTAGVNNIRSAYRTMDDVDGNVGNNTISVNRAGVAFLASLANPQPATGYNMREGSTVEDLARLKVAGPASLRARDRAVSKEDAEVMAAAFQALSDGSKPVVRALAIEESFGTKTVEIVVVGPGGNQVDATKLAEIGDYFNGSDGTDGLPAYDGVLLMNYQATPTNFIEHAINITMTLTDGSSTSVITALTALLNPLATKADGTYTWGFGSSVVVARLIQTIMDTTPPPSNCALSVPSGDVALNTRELPVVGTITINGVVFSP